MAENLFAISEIQDVHMNWSGNSKQQRMNSICVRPEREDSVLTDTTAANGLERTHRHTLCRVSSLRESRERQLCGAKKGLICNHSLCWESEIDGCWTSYNIIAIFTIEYMRKIHQLKWAVPTSCPHLGNGKLLKIQSQVRTCVGIPSTPFPSASHCFDHRPNILLQCSYARDNVEQSKTQNFFLAFVTSVNYFLQCF